MANLIAHARKQLIYRRFADTSDLLSLVYDSLIDYLEERGIIQNKPFDAAACPGAAISDISIEKIAWFLGLARRERKLPLARDASPADTLRHLNLMDEGAPRNAAILLFGQSPQNFRASATIKCVRYHGTEVAKPIPSYQVFEGNLFEQVDNAVDFIMSKLNRAVGTRGAGARAPVKYEIPRDAVAEIIVNAVAHRDYTSTAAVQVSMFADRVEIWNPGQLPQGLTPDQLGQPHASEPPNPFIATPLFLAHYIESLGTGTIDVIRRCHEAGLPAPDFQQRGAKFVVTLWRDWLTPTVLAGFDLNERQHNALAHVRQTGRITNAEYQRATGAMKKTASRDLEEMVTKRLLRKVGLTGRGTHYVIVRKGDIKGTKGTLRAPAQRGHKGDKGDITPRVPRHRGRKKKTGRR